MGAQPVGQRLGQEAVIGVEQGNGPVVARVGAVPRLVDGGDDAVMEGRGQLASGTNGGEEAGEEGNKEGLEMAVQVGGDAVQPRRLARLGAFQCPLDLSS